jgi:hypothetical protein
MAYLSTTYVDNAIGTAVRLKVAPTTASFNQFEAMARMKVRAAGAMAGYSLPNTDAGTSSQLQALALGQFVLLSFGTRKGLTISPFIADQINMLEMVRSGDMPLLDYTPNVRDAIGGVQFTSVDEDDPDGRPQRFSRSELKEW